MITQAAIAQAMTQNDWLALQPIVIVACTALVILVFELFHDRAGVNRGFAMGLGCTGLAIAGYTAYGLYSTPFIAFGGAFISDQFSIVFQGIIIVATALSLLLLNSLDRRAGAAGSSALILWSASGAMVMAGAGNLLTIFLGLEILSLALYALCALSTRPQAREAALKYLLLSSLASAVMLYGMTLLYGCTGSVALSSLLAPPPGALALYSVGIGLFFVGIAFKLGLAPFHIWMPDVFEGAPLPVSAFMSVVTKAGMLAVFARVVYSALPSSMMHQLLAPMWLIAAASMIIGNLGALAQTNLKRLIAYSGIAQIGYIIASFAGGTSYGLRYGIFYLAAYVFMNLGVFAVLSLLSDDQEEGVAMASFVGLGRNNPLAAGMMAFFLIGLAGLPPTAGFMGKILILASAVNSGYVWLAACLIIGTAISIYAYFKIIRTMYVPTRREAVSATLAISQVAWTPWITIGVCGVAVFVLGIYPRIPNAILPMMK
jgi:NADH-quinone oxidoreductase subunit N